MTPSLAASEGCHWGMGPKARIQRLAPLAVVPMPGTFTRISRTMEAPSAKTDIHRRLW